MACRNGSQVAGQLLPAYQTDGAVDLKAGDGGDWAIVARSATGAVLGRYPFQPAWSIPDLGRERDLLSFLYRIPARGGVARVDLEGPDGQLDELDWSAHAPKVTITTPGDDTIAEPVDGTVHVTWTGSDADGDPLLYTVLTSDDGGRVFVAQSVEQTGTSFDVAVPPGGSQVVRELPRVAPPADAGLHHPVTGRACVLEVRIGRQEHAHPLHVCARGRPDRGWGDHSHHDAPRGALRPADVLFRLRPGPLTAVGTGRQSAGGMFWLSRNRLSGS